MARSKRGKYETDVTQMSRDELLKVQVFCQTHLSLEKPAALSKSYEKRLREVKAQLEVLDSEQKPT